MATALLKLTDVQLGVSATATNNFTIYQPTSPDGTVRIGNGNSGSATDIMTLNSSGNVGIGTSSPGYKLQVDGASTSGFVTPLVAKNPSTNAASSVKLGLDCGGTVWGEIGASYNTNDPYMAFFVRSGSEKMRLTDGGNLGLGVTPSAWNTVDRAMQLGASATISGRTNQLALVDITANAYLSNSAWTYINSAAATHYAQVDGTHYWRTAPSGTAGNPITFTQAMTLNASGYLGVGISSPSYRLHISNAGTGVAAIVASDSATSDFFVYPGVSSGVCRIGPDTGAMSLYTAGSERMRIDSSGNVGIGTSSPDSGCKLTVNGGVSIKSYNTAHGASRLVLGQESTTLSQIRCYGDGSTSGSLQFTMSKSDGTGGEAMRIDSSGNLLFNSGYGSVATAYGCRAWVTYNGGGQAIRASGGISSVTYRDAGRYTLNFSNTMPDANYTVVGMTSNDNTGTTYIGAVQDYTNAAPSTTACPVMTGYTGGAGMVGGTQYRATNYAYFAVFR